MANRRIEGTVLITGASGFIGSHLRDALLDAGADVVSLRRPGSPEAKRGRSAVVEYHDRDALRRLVEKERPTFVFHVAGAIKGVTYEDYERANLMPTRNLLDAVREAHPEVRRFVHVSSLVAYGPSTKDRPHREDDPRRPIEHYGRSKLASEEVVEAAGDAVPWTIIRPAGVYGPRDTEYFQLFELIERRINLFFGNRERMFSAVFIDDLVRALLDAAERTETRGKGYFVCDGHPITFGAFQDHIIRARGRRVLTVNLPELLVHVAALGGELATRIDKKPRFMNRQRAIMGFQDAWTCQHDALREDTGYAPQVDIADGVTRTLAWYREQKWL
jgi:nucleoside-diphosphate-sugar epimerase